MTDKRIRIRAERRHELNAQWYEFGVTEKPNDALVEKAVFENDGTQALEYIIGSQFYAFLVSKSFPFRDAS